MGQVFSSSKSKKRGKASLKASAGSGGDELDQKQTRVSARSNIVTILPNPPSPVHDAIADDDEDVPGPEPLSRISSTFTLKSMSTEMSSNTSDNASDLDDSGVDDDDECGGVGSDMGGQATLLSASPHPAAEAEQNSQDDSAALSSAVHVATSTPIFSPNKTSTPSCPDAASASVAVVVPEEYSYEMQQRMTIDDFELLKVIGRGSFGKVMLVRECRRRGSSSKGSISSKGGRSGDSGSSGRGKGGGKLYALKSLRKAALVKRNQIQHTATERIILQQINCPFLVHLVYAFQTVDKLYMALDYVGGGELFFWLRKEKRFSEPRCRLYVAELALGLSALHEAHIVYRDLKPENILLDRRGHLKLTDFGLSKSEVFTHDGTRGTSTFCGTPEYVSPEMLSNKVGAAHTGGTAHGFSVDWWALGTLLYEMLVGLPPFYDKNVQTMYMKILKDPLRFPRDSTKLVLSEASKQFMRRLLDRRVSTRLGGNGIDNEFVNMPFFAGMQFTKVYSREYSPQFVPPNNGNSDDDDMDVSNFDDDFTREAAKDSLVTEKEKMTSTMEEKSAFVGFSYVPAPQVLMQD